MLDSLTIFDCLRAGFSTSNGAIEDGFVDGILDDVEVTKSILFSRAPFNFWLESSAICFLVAGMLDLCLSGGVDSPFEMARIPLSSSTVGN
jgi:hypothetical protein